MVAAAGGAGTGRLVPLRLVAANEVMLYPIEEEVLKRDSWIWVVSLGFVDFCYPAIGVVLKVSEQLDKNKCVLE